MTKHFLKSRIRDQWAYIAELGYRRARNEISFERYEELFISASIVLNNLKALQREMNEQLEMAA